MKIETAVPLKDFTTFKLGGNADFFVCIQSAQELKDAILWSKAQNVPFFVLGGGSNIVVADVGFRGLVIKNEIKGISFMPGEEGGTIHAVVGSGEHWDEFVKVTVEKNLYGLENLSGIPGTVGGTPIQNVGAYGTDVSKSIISVEALRADILELVTLTNIECGFTYRDSYFKTKDGKKYIITAVTFKLSTHGTFNLEYKDVRYYFTNRVSHPQTLMDVRNAILTIRSKKFPDTARIGCAGSFFKNPIVSADVLTTIQKQYPDIPHYKTDDGREKISLAWIFDVIMRYKGIQHGSFGAYREQPLVLVHFGGGTTEDLKKFADKITEAVYKKISVTIVPEILFL